MLPSIKKIICLGRIYPSSVEKTTDSIDSAFVPLDIKNNSIQNNAEDLSVCKVKAFSARARRFARKTGTPYKSRNTTSQCGLAFI